MPGAVLGVSDDLAHGPLDDTARVAYLRDCLRGNIVGATMGQLDEHNLVSESFFSYCLENPVGSGRLEADPSRGPTAGLPGSTGRGVGGVSPAHRVVVDTMIAGSRRSGSPVRIARTASRHPGIASSTGP